MEKLMKDEELARFLGLSEKTIRNRLSAGEDMPPWIRMGRTRRWDPNDVDQWLESHRVGGGRDE